MDGTKKAYSIIEFAKSYSVSRALIYRAIAEGWGPKITKVGRRTLVLSENAQKWAQVLKARSDNALSLGGCNGK